MKLFSLLILNLIPILITAQAKFDLPSETCSYFGKEINENIYSFKSTKEAKEIVSRIVNSVGLEQNFEILAANVPNASAVIKEGKRFILYSQVFIESIEKNTQTKWSSISILAHEIGHHLNGHTLDDIGSRPNKELEADKFSGFVCYKLGANLNEAQAAMRLIASSSGSDTHPPKSARLEAISIGWYNAKEENDKSEKETAKQKSPESQPKDKKTNTSKGDLCIQNIASNRSTWGNLRIKLFSRKKQIREIVINNGRENCFYDLDYGVYIIKYSNYMTKGSQEVRINNSETKINLKNH